MTAPTEQLATFVHDTVSEAVGPSLDALRALSEAADTIEDDAELGRRAREIVEEHERSRQLGAVLGRRGGVDPGAKVSLVVRRRDRRSTPTATASTTAFSTTAADDGHE